MILNSRSVMGRVRPRLLFQSSAVAKEKSGKSSKVGLPSAKRHHLLDYWEELLGSPDRKPTSEPHDCAIKQGQ